MNALRPISAIVALVVLLQLVNCNHAPKADGKKPDPLFPQPISVAANPEGGYAVNVVTGKSIQPLINAFGDTLLTGVPIPVTPKMIHPDSVARPKSVAINQATLSSIDAHPNRTKVPKQKSTFPLDLSKLTTKTVPIVADNDTTHFIRNRTGTIVRTGVPIPAIGNVVKAIHPQPTKALQPVFKDAAIANIQYLDVDQGMNSSYVYAILEDSKGNILLGTWGGGFSVYNGVSFTHFTEKEGLLNNYIRTMAIDSKGHIWLGTLGGLSVYDGESFTNFTENEGLTSNMILFIVEDSNGFIWLGTWGGGVSRFDGTSFTHFTDKEGLSNNYVFSIKEDSKGHIWFGTLGGGVNEYVPPKEGKPAYFTHFTEDDGLLDNSVNYITEDSKGQIWLGTASGISVYDGQSFTYFTEKEGLSNNRIVSIVDDAEGQIWIGTDMGVSMHDGTFLTHFTEKEGLSENRVRAMMKDSKGQIWVGTLAGVSIYDGSSFTHIIEKEQLPNNRVLSILEDSEGHIWLGTEGGGVSVYDGSTFTHFTEKEGLSNNRVLSLLEDSKGNIWFGTGRGVSVYKPYEGGKSASFLNFTDTEGLSGSSVWTMIEDAKGHIWLGTFSNGVSVYDGTSFSHITEKEGLSNNGVRALFRDSKDHIWIASEGGGVSVFDGQSLTHFTEREGLSDNYVGSILEDSQGQIWLGNLDNGVTMYDGTTFTHFTEKEGLSNNSVWSLVLDENENLFVASKKGLSIISGGGLKTRNTGDAPPFSLTVFQKQDGLKGVVFLPNSALIDSKNRGWWGSGKSLTMLNLNEFSLAQQPPLVHLKQLDINDQFIDYRNISENLGREIEFNQVQQFENYPLNLDLPYNKNHLTFHFVAVDWSAPNKINYRYRMLGLNENWSVASKESKADFRSLPHGTFTFQISAIGESGEWSTPFDYSFTINPPWWHTWWAYTLYVLFIGAIIVMIDRYKQKKVERREWHKSQFEKKSMELEHAKEIEKAYFKLEEAHVDLKATQDQLIQQEKLASLGQLSAGIAHEIKNPLNFVNNFAELSVDLLKEVRVELQSMSDLQEDNASHLEETNYILNDIEANLQTIHKHGSRADSIVKAMLMHSKGSSGQFEYVAFNTVVKEYVNLAFHGMRAGKNPISVDINYDFDESVGEVSLVTEDFSRVILNLCNNGFDAMREKLTAANKESSNDYNAILTVRTKRKNKATILEIEDNGPGIPAEIKDKILQPFFTTKKGTDGTGLGLSITNDIIKAHGGKLEINSELGKTNFIITLERK